MWVSFLRDQHHIRSGLALKSIHRFRRQRKPRMNTDETRIKIMGVETGRWSGLQETLGREGASGLAAGFYQSWERSASNVSTARAIRADVLGGPKVWSSNSFEGGSGRGCAPVRSIPSRTVAALGRSPSSSFQPVSTVSTHSV